MDLAITIRTCIIANGTASVQAGAGIVADSVPEREWEETRSKAQALLSAIASVRRQRKGASDAGAKRARARPTGRKKK
jgi:anthranilate synthase component 1